MAALTVGAGGASAGVLGCNYPAAAQSFARWGDSSKYVPVPGGSFETAGGWTLAGGARVVTGNEPFQLGSPGDSRSLELPPGSSAMTPGVCLYLLTPTLRFVGSASDGSGVRVTMYTRTLLGLVQLPSAGYVDLGSEWDASQTQRFLVQNLLGLVNLSQANIYFRFTPVGGATVRMDDVQLDPYFSF
jgi:hypothetical protein